MRGFGISFSPEERLKAAIIGWMVAIEASWIWAHGLHFHVESLGGLAIALVALTTVSGMYKRAGREPQLVAITRETAWLLAFTAAAALLSTLAITTDLPLIDSQLATFDRSLGLDWPWWYAFATSHRAIGYVLAATYVLALPEIAIVIVLLAHANRADRASELVLAAMFGVLGAIAVSTLLPSAGALVYFHPDETKDAVRPMVTLAYKSFFFNLRGGVVHGLSLTHIRGLIAFPSCHATLCVVTLLATRGIPRLFWPLAVLSLLILVSAPVDGGHHFADVLGGIAGGVMAVWAAVVVRERLNRRPAAVRRAEVPSGLAEDA